MNKVRIVHPEVWKMVDNRYEENDVFYPIQLDIEMLMCIEKGYVDTIEERFNESTYQYLKSTLPEKEKWIQVMCFACGMAFAFAVKGGLSSERASAITTKFINDTNKVNDADAFIYLHRDMHIQLAKEVSLLTYCQWDHPVVIRAVEYIDLHINEKIKIKNVAKFCNYSVSALQHIFSKYTNMSLSAYIRKKKIEKACFFLTYSDESCIKISEKLSFGSQSYFIQQFVKEMNMTPKQYRKQFQDSIIMKK